MVSIKDNFLAYELDEFKSKDSVDRYAMYRSFWRGYLEGTFSAALGSWYGMWVHEGEEGMPLFEARCEDGENDKSDLVFRLSIRPPVYGSTFMSLQRELLCPFVLGERARVVRSARGVVEGFVRELAGTDASNENVKGIVNALTWLGQKS